MYTPSTHKQRATKGHSSPHHRTTPQHRPQYLRYFIKPFTSCSSSDSTPTATILIMPAKPLLRLDISSSHIYIFRCGSPRYALCNSKEKKGAREKMADSLSLLVTHYYGAQAHAATQTYTSTYIYTPLYIYKERQERERDRQTRSDTMV